MYTSSYLLSLCFSSVLLFSKILLILNIEKFITSHGKNFLANPILKFSLGSSEEASYRTETPASFFWCCCCCLVAKPCPALLWPHRLQPARLLCPWDFPGKNTGVGGHFLLQGIFPTQGTHVSCAGRQILYHRATGEAHHPSKPPLTKCYWLFPSVCLIFPMNISFLRIKLVSCSSL